MRLLQAMAGAAHGGAENFFVRLAIGLQRAGVPQRVVIRRDQTRAAALREGGVDPVELRFGGIFDWRTRLDLRREISDFKPDVVLTWMNRATAFCPSAKQGEYLHAARLGGYYNLKYYRKCDHLIGNTQGIVDYLVREGWPAERAHYLPNFVTIPQGEPEPRAKFDTPDDAPLLLAMGRLHENKGFDVLVRAMAAAPEAYLWLAGEGPLREELCALAKEAGVDARIRFIGWRDNIGSILRAADVFVCPSRHEPLGNVVLEGWAAGLPVIATDSDGPKSLIEPDVHGVLTPVDDVESLGLGIRRVLEDEDLRGRIARNGREKYLENFTEDIVVRRYVDFLEALVR